MHSSIWVVLLFDTVGTASLLVLTTSSLSPSLTFQAKEVSRLNSIYGNILKNNNVEHIEGKAFIKDEHTVQVLHPETKEVLQELKAKNILISVGGGPARLNVPGGELTITSDEALALPEQPKKIAIIGAGYIAVEFAGIFAGFGTEVHLFYRKELPLTSMLLSPFVALLPRSLLCELGPARAQDCTISLLRSSKECTKIQLCH